MVHDFARLWLFLTCCKSDGGEREGKEKKERRKREKKKERKEGKSCGDGQTSA
jgi:hypothetical protein